MAQVPKNQRVFNSSTGCYKIDIFQFGVYVCSTDQSRSIAQAKKKFMERTGTKNRVYAEYAKR